MKQLLTKGLLCVALVTGLGGSVHAAIIHESATLGPTVPQPGSIILGSTVSSKQFLGSRFSLSQTMVVDHIGGHLLQLEDGLLFGAIIGLASPTALPTGTPFDLGEVLAQTTFTSTFPSSDLLAPLSVALVPGDYGLIFGSGLFEATGVGSMPFNNVDIPGSGSYFFWDGRLSVWRNDAPSNLRFVVTGSPLSLLTPEPCTMLLLGTGLAGLVSWRRKKEAGKTRE